VVTKRFLMAVSAIVLSANTALADDLPDSAKTPGAVLETVPDEQVASCLSNKTGTNVKVSDAITIRLICTPGYSRCIRDVPQIEKTSVYRSYGLMGNHTGYCDTTQGCEVDHLISLKLGGSNDQTNLWPEPYQGTTWNAHVKDQLENSLHRQVCQGNIALDQAQQEIAKDWITSYKARLGNR
jgi:hypothetical protein